MEPKWTLRAARAEDLAVCAAMDEGSLIHKYYFSRPGTLESVLRRAQAAGQLWLAAGPAGEAGGLIKVVPRGFCGLYPYLSLITVGESFRGKGVGRFLMDCFEDMGRADGARKAALLVSDFNAGARTMYLRRGYREIGLIPDAALDGVGEYLMIKDL